MGVLVASSVVTLIKNRPSGATSYCCLLKAFVPPPQIRVWNNTTGTPGSSVAPLTVIGTVSFANIRSPGPPLIFGGKAQQDHGC